jgi:hypothetical protein
MLLREQGAVVENYARRLAGGLGVPDFVYTPTIVTKGSGNREVGDGLLVAGDDGLVVQPCGTGKSSSRSSTAASTSPGVSGRDRLGGPVRSRRSMVVVPP